MGQDTYSTFGVSIEVATTFKDRQLLYRLVSLLGGCLHCFIQEKYDEVNDLTDRYIDQIEDIENRKTDVEPNEYESDEENSDTDEDFDSDDYLSVNTLRKLSLTTTPEEYDKILQGKNIVYYFMYSFINGSVRGISRRQNPCVFHLLRETPSLVIEQIKQASRFFRDEGIPEDKLCTGCYFVDST